MLVPCERCKRHISVREEACPFCRQSNALSRLGAVALSAGIAVAGCDAGHQANPTQGSAAVETKAYGAVHGTVTERGGKPVPAIITVTSTDDPSGVRTYTRTVGTDDQGRFSIDLLPPGAYTSYAGYDLRKGRMELTGDMSRQFVVKAGDDVVLDYSVELRQMSEAMPYGAPPARRRVV